MYVYTYTSNPPLAPAPPRLTSTKPSQGPRIPFPAATAWASNPHKIKHLRLKRQVISLHLHAANAQNRVVLGPCRKHTGQAHIPPTLSPHRTTHPKRCTITTQNHTKPPTITHHLGDHPLPKSNTHLLPFVTVPVTHVTVFTYDLSLMPRKKPLQINAQKSWHGLGIYHRNRTKRVMSQKDPLPNPRVTKSRDAYTKRV